MGDEPAVFQFSRAERHAEVAHQLLAEGKAYRCYATSEELEQMREQQRAAKQPLRYDRRWRDRDPTEAVDGAPFVVRLKAPLDGETTIADQVQGAVTVQNAEIDDFVLLRSDGTPTRSEEHTSELQSLMRISYAVFCLKKKTKK